VSHREEEALRAAADVSELRVVAPHHEESKRQAAFQRADCARMRSLAQVCRGPVSRPHGDRSKPNGRTARADSDPLRLAAANGARRHVFTAVEVPDPPRHSTRRPRSGGQLSDVANVLFPTCRLPLTTGIDPSPSSTSRTTSRTWYVPPFARFKLII